MKSVSLYFVIALIFLSVLVSTAVQQLPQLTGIEHNPCISPNNDDLNEAMSLTANFIGKPNKNVYAFLFIRQDTEFLQLLARTSRFPGSGETSISLLWDGTNELGQMVPDGTYQLEEKGDRRPKTKRPVTTAQWLIANK